MTLSKEDIRNLKKLYEKYSSVELTDEEFKQKAKELVNLNLLLVLPNSNRAYEDY